MKIDAKEAIENIPEREETQDLKNGLKEFYYIYKEGSFKEMVSSFIALLETTQRVPYSETLFLSAEDAINNELDIEAGINNIDEDSIEEDKKEQIKEWFNFVMLIMAKLTQKYKTLIELGKESDNIQEDNKNNDLEEILFNKEDLVKA